MGNRLKSDKKRTNIRVLICLIIMLCVVVVLGRVIFIGMTIGRNDATYGMLLNLTDFVIDNDLYFPQDWDEFREWYIKENDRPCLEFIPLEDTFTIPWGMSVAAAISNDMKMVTVAYPKIKALESGLNYRFETIILWRIDPSKELTEKIEARIGKTGENGKMGTGKL